MMLPTLIDRALVSLMRERDSKREKRRTMRVLINHDLNQISTSARAPIDSMEKSLLHRNIRSQIITEII
jgi:hypothetical protein